MKTNKIKKLKSTILAVALATTGTFGVATLLGSMVAHAQVAPLKPSTYTTAIGNYKQYFDEAHLDSYVSIMDYMRDYVTPEDYSKSFLPIKVAAAKAKVMLRAHGPISQATHEALVMLVVRITQAGTSLDALLSIQAHYNTAVDLLTLQEMLKDSLD